MLGCGVHTYGPVTMATLKPNAFGWKAVCISDMGYRNGVRYERGERAADEARGNKSNTRHENNNKIMEKRRDNENWKEHEMENSIVMLWQESSYTHTSTWLSPGNEHFFYFVILSFILFVLVSLRPVLPYFTGFVSYSYLIRVVSVFFLTPDRCRPETYTHTHTPKIISVLPFSCIVSFHPGSVLLFSVYK